MEGVSPFLRVFPFGYSISGQTGIEDVPVGAPDNYVWLSARTNDAVVLKYKLLLISVLAASGAGRIGERSRMVTFLYPRLKR